MSTPETHAASHTARRPWRYQFQASPVPTACTPGLCFSNQTPPARISRSALCNVNALKQDQRRTVAERCADQSKFRIDAHFTFTSSTQSQQKNTCSPKLYIISFPRCNQTPLLPHSIPPPDLSAALQRTAESGWWAVADVLHCESLPLGS